jgi:hypothetical protein
MLKFAKKMKILKTTYHDKLGFVEGIINAFAMLDYYFFKMKILIVFYLSFSIIICKKLMILHFLNHFVIFG